MKCKNDSLVAFSRVDYAKHRSESSLTEQLAHLILFSNYFAFNRSTIILVTHFY